MFAAEATFVREKKKKQGWGNHEDPPPLREGLKYSTSWFQQETVYYSFGS